MDAYEISEPTPDYGGIVRTERDVPEPDRDEALVRIHACSLKWHDLAVANSELTFGVDVAYPVVPLSDGAGEVVEVGDDVRRVAAGDRVATTYSPNWIDGPATEEKLTPMGGVWDGVLAEYVTFPARSLVHLPASLSFEEGATLPSTGLVAWQALSEDADLGPEESVLILGTGGVATFALQFAELRGARSIVLSSSDEKLEVARELGARETINYEDTPGWDEVVVDLTDGGVDHVVEAAGAGTLNRSLEAAAVNGTVHFISFRTTGWKGPIARPILHSKLTLSGVWGGGSRAMFERMNRAIENAGLSPVIDTVYDAADVREAYRHLDAGGHQGKLVVSLS